MAMAVAGTAITTPLSIAEISGVSVSEKRRVMRVSFVPISTTSSAESEVIAGGSVDGTMAEASRLVPVRSMTNTPGDGL
jgi:hypothetical protein